MQFWQRAAATGPLQSLSFSLRHTSFRSKIWNPPLPSLQRKRIFSVDAAAAAVVVVVVVSVFFNVLPLLYRS